jgi:hypothetical protein
MTLIEALQAHKGGLLLLKTELFWYDGRGWDGITGRVCLLLNAPAARTPHVAAAVVRTVASTPAATARRSGSGATIELLVDGCPCWVWVAPADVELL